MTALRRADRSDFDAVAALYAEFNGRDQVAGRAQFERVIAHPGTEIWLAEAAGIPRSMATLHVLPNMTWGGRPYALVENVITAKAFWRRGLGTKVMSRVAKAAWAADCYKIMLLTGRTNAARGFYETLGFSADEKWGMTLCRAPER